MWWSEQKYVFSLNTKSEHYQEINLLNTVSAMYGCEVAECKLLSAYPLVTEFDSSWSHNSRNHACAIKLSHLVIDSAINYCYVPVHQQIPLLKVSDPVVVLTLKLIVRFIVGLTGIYVTFRLIALLDTTCTREASRSRTVPVEISWIFKYIIKCSS